MNNLTDREILLGKKLMFLPLIPHGRGLNMFMYQWFEKWVTSVLLNLTFVASAKCHFRTTLSIMYLYVTHTDPAYVRWNTLVMIRGHMFSTHTLSLQVAYGTTQILQWMARHASSVHLLSVCLSVCLYHTHPLITGGLWYYTDSAVDGQACIICPSIVCLSVCLSVSHTPSHYRWPMVLHRFRSGRPGLHHLSIYCLSVCLSVSHTPSHYRWPMVLHRFRSGRPGLHHLSIYCLSVCLSVSHTPSHYRWAMVLHGFRSGRPGLHHLSIYCLSVCLYHTHLPITGGLWYYTDSAVDGQACIICQSIVCLSVCITHIFPLQVAYGTTQIPQWTARPASWSRPSSTPARRWWVTVTSPYPRSTQSTCTTATSSNTSTCISIISDWRSTYASGLRYGLVVESIIL